MTFTMYLKPVVEVDQETLGHNHHLRLETTNGFVSTSLFV